jgi:excisionase family DNA binding protein
MKWLKIDGACRHAAELDRKTLYAAVDAGELRVARVGTGRNMLFAAEWIDEWLTARAHQPRPLSSHVPTRERVA